MGIKKKLSGGALAATMGLALVGGGTFAAFNDVEALDNQVAAGTLDLNLASVDGSMEFQLSDLKPGDRATRTIKMENAGSLAIKDVLLSIENVTFKDGKPGDRDMGDNGDKIDFLEQFEVTVIKVGAEGSGDGEFPKIITGEANITLADLHKASQGDGTAKSKILGAVTPGYVSNDGRINIATVNPDEWTGIPVVPEDPDNVQITVEFVDDDTKDDQDKYYLQNKFQGDSADVTFTLEARQWGGLNIQEDDVDDNGYIKTNEKAHSEG
ncbi:TasA family protein [Halobacillus ihumii]|uniref:TasA family protein n=1 Tax=Halobacillus ihumii TaxID=2686092 RepID=UPI0013D1B816|nr:TasA family protein [Halobacillus ihumii]